MIISAKPWNNRNNRNIQLYEFVACLDGRRIVVSTRSRDVPCSTPGRYTRCHVTTLSNTITPEPLEISSRNFQGIILYDGRIFKGSQIRKLLIWVARLVRQRLWCSPVCLSVDFPPSLESIIVNNWLCPSVRMSVCVSRSFKLLLLFCFSMESSHFWPSVLHVALYKPLFFDFWFRPPNPQNLLHKICTKSPIG